MADMDFWFSIGSTYSYLTVARLADAATRANVTVRWRPFNVRTIMIEQKNIPFSNKPVKTAYMWRDIERRAAGYGLPVSVPAPYPLAELALANQVALLGMREGWGEAYTVETYRRWFVEGAPAGEDPNLSGSLATVGQDPEGVLTRATSAEIVDALEEETRIAETIGVFGAPTFVVSGEVFWGDDRLDDALGWELKGKL